MVGNIQVFAKLIYIFTYTVGESQYPLALVQMLDQPLDQCQTTSIRIDRDLGFYRVWAKPRNSCEFIPIRSIVRGALLFDAFEGEGESLVVDTVDADMYLRVKQLFRKEINEESE